MRSASIKQSDFPNYMMPFFALMMLEGRMLNAIQKVIDEEGITPEDDPKDFKEAFLAMKCGYNEYIVMQGKTLKTICQNDTTFEQDFSKYLRNFDDVLKELLGIDRGPKEQKYLKIIEIIILNRAIHIII
jgi:type I restriction enzyme M protein